MDQSRETERAKPAISDVVAGLARDPAFASLRPSFVNYYDDVARNARLDALTSRFVVDGDLAFDIGSHVGDRISALRRAGARVVALEPQPLCATAIRRIYAGDASVTVVEAACGATEGKLPLKVNSSNPTVSTLSDSFVASAADADGWREQVWDTTIDVPVTTLDALIARYGVPAFVKIDVEGFEADVLAGLSVSLPALSFEFTTINRDVAVASIQQVMALGGYSFNAALGETHELVFPTWVSADEAIAYVTDIPHEANSGDFYAVREMSR